MTALTRAKVEPVIPQTTIDNTSGATTPINGNGGGVTYPR
jgi:hypothetical protein